MKSGKKALLLALCAVLLVAATVMGTMAYLTATTGPVVNTFTIGNIAITLDEAKVDLNGVKVEDASRVTENLYKLVPSHEYAKDPTVHVDPNSENSYIFVKVENGIANFEASNNKIADQIVHTYGWNELGTVSGVYYKMYTKGGDTEFKVFDHFTIADDANTTDGWDSITNASITVTAYAVQSDGITSPADAWAAIPQNPGA